MRERTEIQLQLLVQRLLIFTCIRQPGVEEYAHWGKGGVYKLGQSFLAIIHGTKVLLRYCLKTISYSTKMKNIAIIRKCSLYIIVSQIFLLIMVP